jgi:hypothetical protein
MVFPNLSRNEGDGSFDAYDMYRNYIEFKF